MVDETDAPTADSPMVVAAEAEIVPPKRSAHIKRVEAAIADAIVGEIQDAGGDPAKYIRNVRRLVAGVEKVSAVSSLDADIGDDNIGVINTRMQLDRPPMQEMVDLMREAFDTMNQTQKEKLAHEIEMDKKWATLTPALPVAVDPVAEVIGPLPEDPVDFPPLEEDNP